MIFEIFMFVVLVMTMSIVASMGFIAFAWLLDRMMRNATKAYEAAHVEKAAKARQPKEHAPTGPT